MRISDWISDVCSSDLACRGQRICTLRCLAQEHSMDSELARRADAPRDISDLLRTLADVDGTAGHGYPSASGLGHRGDLTRNIANLADAAHYLCMLHGRHPGVIDHAAMRTAHKDRKSNRLNSSHQCASR